MGILLVAFLPILWLVDARIAGIAMTLAILFIYWDHVLASRPTSTRAVVRTRTRRRA